MAPMIGFRKHRPHSTRVFPQPARATLFPGLDRFAQSLNVYHPLWDILPDQARESMDGIKQK